MIYTITIVLSLLVATNFLLLFFSCNKTKRAKKEIRKPHVLKPVTTPKVAAQLAPTGS